MLPMYTGLLGVTGLAQPPVYDPCCTHPPVDLTHSRHVQDPGCTHPPLNNGPYQITGVTAVPAVPVVTTQGGRPVTTSRAVAEFFRKEHRNVLRDIDALNLAAGGMLNFEQTLWTNPQNGQTYREFTMDRDGFSLLAMGFTGAEALRFKLQYIAEFNRMEAALNHPAPAVPQTLPEALRLAADLADRMGQLSERVSEQAEQINADAPKVQAFNRFMDDEGLFGIREAAKLLMIAEQTHLIPWMISNDWLYRAGAYNKLQAQVRLIKSGHMRHVSFIRANGCKSGRPQPKLTAKGVIALDRSLPAHIRYGLMDDDTRLELTRLI